MANHERGELALKVEGASYTLRPTFDALCELEGLLGRPFDSVMKEIQQGRLSGLRAVIWCLLQDQHGDEIKTLKDASQWVERAGGPDTALEAIYKVFRLNMDAAIESSAADPQPAQVGTSEGSSSVPSGTA